MTSWGQPKVFIIFKSFSIHFSMLYVHLTSAFQIQLKWCIDEIKHVWNNIECLNCVFSSIHE
jgi:hypothetical protein